MGEGPEERGMVTKGNIGEGKEMGNGTCILIISFTSDKKVLSPTLYPCSSHGKWDPNPI